MNEALRDWVARIAAETERQSEWLEFEEDDGATHLVAGGVDCLAEAVAFDDDSGLRAELRYGAILAVRSGRLGEAGGCLRRPVPAFLSDMAA